MPHLIRRSTTRSESLTLLTDTGAVTIELTVRGEFAELDASAIELLLHAPLTVLASRGHETI